jgi:predicted transposase YbfD/YdcC
MVLLVGHPRMPVGGVVDKANWNTPEHFLAILQKEHAATCNLLLQRDKFAKKLEDKLAKKDQDALVKTEKMKTKHREEKKRIRNDTASDKDQLMKKIKK